MIKLGVKKPYTILVAVIAVIVIGIVALTEMQTDLLPDIETPYLIVVTTYPGATPEKVEENVTKVMEAGLGTINGVLNVRSTSAENYSMVMLEFEEDTDMDAVLVKVSAAVNQVKGMLPETCGNPNILEISMNMLASIYTSVAYEGKDIFELSDFVEDIVVPQIERID
nr:efflux RND transporter permease subunit [Lachnospiraceae bacterium]